MTIFYGVCIGNEEKYQRYAVPGLQRIGAMGRVIESRRNRSIFTAYNRILNDAAAAKDLEALVLLHEDLEIRDDAFESKVLAALEEDVAIVGTVGGRGPTGIRWFEAHERFGRQPDTTQDNNYGGGRHDVDQVDGCLMVMSPDAVQTLRFDTKTFSGFHGYDADICMQAKAAGQRVTVAEFDTFHHTKGGFGNISEHQRIDDRFCRKWGLPLAPWPYRRDRLYPRIVPWRRRALRLVNTIRRRKDVSGRRQ